MTQAAGVVAVAETPVLERWRHVALLLALSSLLFFLNLGGLNLTDRDEGSNAEAAREMVETGDWVSPTLNYEPRFAKPVLVYWLMSGAYALFGPSEVAARLPSAIFGVALILLHYFFILRVREPVLALMSGLMLLLNVEIVAIGRTAIMDSVLTFFTTLALFCFWLGLHGEGRARHYIWGFYAGMGLATLTKGPVGFLIPLLAVVAYLSCARRWGQFWRHAFPLSGALLFIILAVPWYAVMLSIHGSSYTESASANTIGRFLNVIGGHGGTVLFYLPVLAFGFWPWSGLLPFAIYQNYTAWRAARREIRSGWHQEPITSLRRLLGAPDVARPSELEFFAGCWLVVGVVFFSLSATRLPHYIAPLFPPAAILAACYLDRCLASPATPGLRGSFRTIMILGYVLGLLLASVPALYSTFVDQITKEFPMARDVAPGLSPVVAGAILFVGSGLIGFFGLTETRRSGAFWVAGTTIGLVMLIAIQVALPRFSHDFIAPPQQLAYIAGENLAPGDTLILYGRPKPSLLFYAKRKAVFIKPGQEASMRPHLGLGDRTMILLPSRLRSRLPAEARDYTPLLRRSGYMLLADRPMIELPARAPASSAPPPFPHGRR